MQNMPEMIVMEQDEAYVFTDLQTKQMRVAAYCRVSTDHEEQQTSFKLQTEYYREYVSNHSHWSLVDVYADEGFSATNTKRRDGFNRMIQDCERGKVDLVICKNVSRFSRNVLDCLGTAKKLAELRHPVGIFFEEQNINTLNRESRLMLNFLSTLAEWESQAKSESMEWSIVRRFKERKFLTPTNYLLGYDRDANKKLIIEEDGANTIRAIYKAFLAGYSLKDIAFVLSDYGRPTGKGSTVWGAESVRRILLNERYSGGVYTRKTYTKDPLDHKKVKNYGAKDSIYQRQHHPAIVTEVEYLQALKLLKSQRGSPYYNPYYTVRVIREGLLAGFIPMCPVFGFYQPKHYVGALEAAQVELPPIRGETVDVKDAAITRIQEFSHSTVASLTVSPSHLSFNTECVELLGEAEHVELLFHPKERILAVRAATADNHNALLWRNKSIGAKQLSNLLYVFCGWNKPCRYKIMADSFCCGDEKVLMFDLAGAEFFIQSRIEQKTTNPSGTELSMWMKITRLLQPEDWERNFGKTCKTHATQGRRWLAQSLDDWFIHASAKEVPGFDGYSPEAPAPIEDWLKEPFEEGYIDALNQNFYSTEVIENVQ